jgi:heat shock protein HslJ
MRKRNRVAMPRWPAWVMLAGAAACAYPALTAPVVTEEHYEARGEPGWHLRIHDERIDYAGNEGAVRLTVPRPEARPTASGRRYRTERLTVDLSYARCNDPKNGFGYEHRVTVIADGRALRGCGGERRADWDA